MSTVEDVRPFGLRMLGRPEESVRVTRIRVQLLLTASIASANLVGAMTVFVLATFVIPGPALNNTEHVVALNLTAAGIYVAVALVVGTIWGTRLITEHGDWLLAGRQPTERERRVVLQLPIILTGVQAALWIPAAAIFALFNAFLGDHLTVEVAVTVLMGGLLTCANSYVVSELIARPLAARALASGPPSRLHVPGVRARSTLAWLLSSAVPVTGLIVVAALALTRGGTSTTRLAVTVIVLGAIALMFGFRITLVAGRANSDPIKSLRRAVERVEKGDYDVAVPIYDGTEIGLLQAGFNRMAEGLREREHIREEFGRHVGEAVVASALESGPALGGVACDVGVLFVDLIGSTTLAATRPASDVVEVLNRFFAVVVDAVVSHGGAINKFEGDGALAVFGAPLPLPDPASAALAAGRDLHARLLGEVPDCDAGIGVAAGRAVAGNIGAVDRYEYTVIGDPVNEAARLSELAKSTPGRVVGSRAAVDRADPQEASSWVASDEVLLRGRKVPTATSVPARTGS